MSGDKQQSVRVPKFAKTVYEYRKQVLAVAWLLFLCLIGGLWVSTMDAPEAEMTILGPAVGGSFAIVAFLVSVMIAPMFKEIGQRIMSHIDTRGAIRALAFIVVWVAVAVPLVFVFIVSASTAFEYRGIEVPWWLSQWVGISLTAVMIAPVGYVTIRELKPSEDSEGDHD